jgi:hypothetical protein
VKNLGITVEDDEDPVEVPEIVTPFNMAPKVVSPVSPTESNTAWYGI